MAAKFLFQLAFDGVPAVSQGWLINPSEVAEQAEGQVARVLLGHDWEYMSGLPVGSGVVSVEGKTLYNSGEIHDPQAALRLQEMMEFGPVQASIGFFGLESRLPTKREQGKGAEVVFTALQVIESSVVLAGAIEGARLVELDLGGATDEIQENLPTGNGQSGGESQGGGVDSAPRSLAVRAATAGARYRLRRHQSSR